MAPKLGDWSSCCFACIVAASNEILAPTLVVAVPEADADVRRGTRDTSAPRSGVLAMPASSLAERYRIDGVVAEGGMATVYRAWHCLLDQPVALKMLRPEYSSVPEIAQRFLHEARAMARLRSKHAVRVMDFGGTVEGTPYMVLELLTGKDLQQVLAQQGAQPIQRAIEFVLQAADAVSEAHATGLVHRDIKPANLFLAKEDGAEIIKVIDFGISKSMCRQSEYRTLSKSYLGSPQYMSPEQIRSAASVDERTDIWSLGVVLYELLTGRPPFTAATLPALCASVVSDTPILPEQLPAPIRGVVMRCLAKRREDRYSTVTELHEALAHCLGAVEREVAEPKALVSPNLELLPLCREHSASQPQRRSEGQSALEEYSALSPSEAHNALEAPPAASPNPGGADTVRRQTPRSGVVSVRARAVSLVCGGVAVCAAAAVWGVDAASLPETATPALTVPATEAELFEPVSRVQAKPVVEAAADAAHAVTPEPRPNRILPRTLRPPSKASPGVQQRSSAKKPSPADRVSPTETARGDSIDMEARYALTYQPEVGTTEPAAGPALAADALSERADSEPPLVHSGL